MIVRSLCNSCLQPYTLLVMPSDVDLLRQISTNEGQTCPCPRLCGGTINLVGEPTITDAVTSRRLREPLHISGKELYQAVNGLGLPDEVAKDLTVIKALFGTSKVVGIQMEEQGENLYLHEIKLENGITVHLGAGQRGAKVLKLTKERKSGTPSPG